MSAAGISAFYGASSVEVALAEIGQPERFTVGEFSALSELSVLDLVELPTSPSFFDLTAKPLRLALHFLRRFAIDVSRPIATDGQTHHFEYTPTQVVAEFMWRRFGRLTGLPLHGIRYRSARDPNGWCVIIFGGEEIVCDVGGEAGQWGVRPLLRLDRVVVSADH